MRVLVTGGAGYVGAQTVAHLLRGGHAVTVYDTLMFGGEHLLTHHGAGALEILRGDVRDGERLSAAMRGAEAVVHLAAIVGEDACKTDETAAWAINFDGARTAIDAAGRAGLSRFVFVSTCSNYGVSDPGSLATEDAALNPLSSYARAKVEAERAILEEAGDVCATILRLGTICGVSPRMRFDLLIGDLARLAAAGRAIELFTPDAWRPFLHVQDAARAIGCLLDADPARIGGRIFNVVGENVQKRALEPIVRARFPDAKIEVVDRAPDRRDYRVSAERIRAELGFEAKRTVADAFNETADAVQSGVFRSPFDAIHSAIPPGPL